MDNFEVSVRVGSEEERAAIWERFPHTRAVLRDGGVLLTAFRGPEPVGFLWMFRRALHAPVHRNEWFINVVDVPDASDRLRGVGSALVREAAEIAREDGAYQISAYCDIANVASHMLWVKNGFAVSPAYGPDGAVCGSFAALVL